MKLAPIALFSYNRPAHTARLINSLLRNREAADTELYIFSDAAGRAADAGPVAEVRSLVGGLTGFKRVHLIERSRNLGLAASIESGVRELCDEHGAAVVLEDDLVVSAYLLRYCNEALTAYEHDERVISIGCYMFPVGRPLPEAFFLRVPDCWGWAVWKRSWDLYQPDGAPLLAEIRRRSAQRAFDFNDTYPYTRMLADQIAGKNNSWAVRWYARAFLLDRFTLYPGRSLVRNTGMDASGVHGGVTSIYDVEVAEQPVALADIEVRENILARDSIEQFFRETHSRGKLHASIRRMLVGISPSRWRASRATGRR